MGSRKQELEASCEELLQHARDTMAPAFLRDMEYAAPLIEHAVESFILLQEVLKAWARGESPGEFGEHRLAVQFNKLCREIGGRIPPDSSGG